MKFFNREFRNLDAPFLQELQTLESEGAIYEQFWREDSAGFRFCRIQFFPAEIVTYVDALTAYDEFERLYQEYGDPDLALSEISDSQTKHRVEDYNNWVFRTGSDDQAFCPAAFLGEHLEALRCGQLSDRYEFLSQTYTGDRRYILTEILEMFPSSVSYLSRRTGNRPSYNIEREQDVRDLLYAITKTVFPDARIEEHTRIHASGTKLIDIVIPQISTVIEIKYVRDHQHVKKIADELKIDFESYHVHTHCKNLIAYVWDQHNYLPDRSNFIRDLRGLRAKGNSRFTVDVVVKP